MKDSYSIFSKYYRQLIKDRGHFQDQAKVVRQVIDIYGINKNAKILDVACGTGDVACTLYDSGYNKIQGVDGNSEMLMELNSLYEEKVVTSCIDWSDIDTFFSKERLFDVVYGMGHSIPHLTPKDIPLFFFKVYEGLEKGGIWMFDVRLWDLVEGSYKEIGRVEDVDCFLGKIIVNENSFWVFEEVTYQKDIPIQKIKYKFCCIEDVSKNQECTLEYHIFNKDTILKWMLNVGFLPSNIRFIKFPNWKYLVVIGQK